MRAIARTLGLPSASKPAAPCLASRIPHYQAVTPTKLRQIEQAESSLRAMGFSELRVRHHGEIARIELPPDDLVRAVTDPMRGSIRKAVVAAGFRFAAVDLAVCSPAPSPCPWYRSTMTDGTGLSTFATLDFDRAQRRGYPEAVYCEGKTVEQVRTIAAAHRDRSTVTTLFTRADQSRAEAILEELPGAMHDPTARLLAWPPAAGPARGGLVVVIAAGTSDLPVAREALLTTRYLGRETELVVDVGVAGLHRILGHLELLRRAQWSSSPPAWTVPSPVWSQA